MKTRGINQWPRKLGKLEPLAFLHAWHETDPPEGSTHRNCTPPNDLLAAAHAMHNVAFEALHAQPLESWSLLVPPS